MALGVTKKKKVHWVSDITKRVSTSIKLPQSPLELKMILPILEMKKLRLRELMSLDPNHKVSKA